MIQEFKNKINDIEIHYHMFLLPAIGQLSVDSPHDPRNNKINCPRTKNNFNKIKKINSKN